MIDGLLVCGDEARIGGRLRELLDMGAAEIMVTPVLAGADKPAALDRTLKLVGQIAQSLA